MPGFEWLDNMEAEAVVEVIKRGILFRYDTPLGQGKYVKEFEEAFASYIGSQFAIAVNNGSAALKVALVALGIGINDEVITQGFTFVATWEAILECGAKPIFCEINQSLCMDPEDLKKKITKNTRCIIPVHMMGAQAEINKIKNIADAHSIPILEDAAQAIGCTVEGKYIGTIGTFGTFSMDAVKTITTGEGGIIVTDNESLYRNASEYQDHGHDHKPVGRANENRRFFGFNFRMMELQGALGLVQLSKLDKMLTIYRRNKSIIKKALSLVPGLTFRNIVDPFGDSATFITWFMPNVEMTNYMATILAKHKVPAISWNSNKWHVYHLWEHLHAKKTLHNEGWPFNHLKKIIHYSQNDLPNTRDILSRCLSWQIMLNWDNKKIKQIFQAIEHVIAIF